MALVDDLPHGPQVADPEVVEAARITRLVEDLGFRVQVKDVHEHRRARALQPDDEYRSPLRRDVCETEQFLADACHRTRTPFRRPNVR